MGCIDAEKLKSLLDAKYKDFREKAKIEGYTTLQYQYMADGIDIAEQFIDSLQQEQPEVDLDEGITAYIESHFHIRYDETLEVGNDPLTTADFEAIARHFFELGLNARKEK